MDAAVTEHNSLCVARSPDDSLQVFRAEVDSFKENFFCRPRCCPRERVDVELRLYSSVFICRMIDWKQLELCGSAVVEESCEVCVCVWNSVDVNSVEVRQPEFWSCADSHLSFLLIIVESDLEDTWDLLRIKFELIKIIKLYLLC